MKTRLLCLLVITLFSFAKCNKDKDANGLPAATQEGKNTLGFMLNGQPWTPKGNVGFTANLTIDVDFGFRNGGFSLASYRIVSDANTNSESFGIGLKDSLNFLSVPATLSISRISLPGVRFGGMSCSYYSTDVGTTTSGTLDITKLDKINRIIAGTFNATLSKSGCSTIQITEGRFDMKY